jgi:hypothetical protein
LRHCLATLAYRGGKVVRDAPADFGPHAFGPTGRTPLQILAHIGDLLEWALSLARGAEAWRESSPTAWDAEVQRFFALLGQVDAYLGSPAPLGCSPERLFQGPIADALTHVGQLAMLRRVVGAPIGGENYFAADIAAGRVGRDQASPRREFE